MNADASQPATDSMDISVYEANTNVTAESVKGAFVSINNDGTYEVVSDDDNKIETTNRSDVNNSPSMEFALSMKSMRIDSAHQSIRFKTPRESFLNCENPLRSGLLFNSEKENNVAPKIKTESTTFLLPEDQLEVKISPRIISPNVSKYTLKSGPLYLTTCYEEFSRKFVTVEIACQDNTTQCLELEKPIQSPLDEKEKTASPQHVLKAYHPGYDYWLSTFRKEHPERKVTMLTPQFYDFGLLIKVFKVSMKQKFFEPIFGSLCLYAFINDEFHRVTESFYFDATPEPIRKNYPVGYENCLDGSNPSHTVADVTGSDSHLNMFCTNLPKEVRNGSELYVVVQLTKILSSDPDKALLPYLPKGALPDMQKHRDACERLGHFRQPVGFAVAKVFDDSGRLLIPWIGRTSLPVFAQRICLNDPVIAQVLKELHPKDNTAPYQRFDQLDIEVILGMQDLGDLESQSIAERIQSMNIFPSTPGKEENSEMNIIPSEVPSEGSQLAYAQDIRSNKPGSAGQNIKAIMPLITSSSASSSSLSIWSKQFGRQLRTSVSNCMFVYIQQFDKFPTNFRNLCVKIELIEASENIADRLFPASSKSSNLTQETLTSIYNHSYFTGPEVVKEAHSRVSYHTRNSLANDEIKIKLPDVLSSRHWIKFTVLHVHVKPHKPSLLSSIMRPSTSGLERDEQDDSTQLGVGYIALFANNNSLIGDAEHIVPIFGNNPNSGIVTQQEFLTSGASNEFPSIRIRTKTLCSLVSSEKQIQNLLRNIPLPLGCLPSSVMPESIALQILNKASALKPKEDYLLYNLEEVVKASSIELSRHFLVIMRGLLRCMLGGTCVYDENYMNPFKHCKARCRSFLTMLKLFEKIFNSSAAAGTNGTANGNGSGGNSSDNAVGSDKLLLEIYIDYLFDEEVPLSRSMLSVNSQSASSMTPISTTRSVLKKLPKSTATGTGESVVGSFVEDINYCDFEDPVSSRPLNEVDVSQGSSSAAQRRFSRPGTDSPAFPPLPPSSSPPSVSFLPVVANGRQTPTVPSPAAGADEQEESGSGSEVSLRSGSGQNTKSSGSDIKLNIIRKSFHIPLQASEDFAVNGNNTTGFDDLPTVGEADVVLQVAVDLPIISTSEKPAPLTITQSSKKITRNTSESRKSWGKYVTDSYWSSGALMPMTALNEIVANSPHTPRSPTPTPASVTTNQYLENIAMHIVYQAERVIIGDLVNLAIDLFLETHEQELYAHELDKAVKFQHHQHRQPDRFFFLPALLPTAMNEKSFEDDLRMEVTRKSDDSEECLRQSTEEVESPIARKTVADIAPLYDALTGYRERSGPILAEDPTIIRTLHWWPWLYEVLVFQWGATLVLILSSSNLISRNHIDSIVGTYPFEAELTQSSNSHTTSNKKDWRFLLMEYGPYLLKIIHKSMALRIHRESKRPPVLLDEQFYNALENLIMLVSVECSTITFGLWRSRRMISSLANYLRSLFALIAPSQVIRLVKAFFKAIKKGKSRVEEVELRLLMIEELSYFDHFIAVNFPYYLDAPLMVFAPNLLEVDPGWLLQFNPSFTSMGIRTSTCPNPYTFVHMILSEILNCCKLEVRKREAAWEILRDLMVRHAYDSRYQTLEAQQRIICMYYMPIVSHVIEERESIGELAYYCDERKEMLSLFVYLLNGVPSFVLRFHVRQLCFRMIKSRASNLKESKEVPSKNPDLLKNNYSDAIFEFVRTLHLVLDTFEAPMKIGGLNSASIRDDELDQLLAPNVLLDLRSEINSANVDQSRKQSASIGNADVLTGGNNALNANRSSAVTSTLLANLDQRMQRKASATKIPANRRSANLSKHADERKWIEHARVLAADASNTTKDKQVGSRSISKQEAQTSIDLLNYFALQTVLKVLVICFEECPIAFAQGLNQTTNAKNSPTPTASRSQRSGSANSMKYPSFSSKNTLPSSSIESEASSISQSALNIIMLPFLKEAYTVLLHALYASHSSDGKLLAELFEKGFVIMKQYGAKCFLTAVQDGLQYWLRIILFYLATKVELIRTAASNFFFALLQSTFEHYGSFTNIPTTIFAVFNDSVTIILDTFHREITSHDDEDTILEGLLLSIRAMKALASQKMKSLPDKTASSSGKHSLSSAASIMTPFCASVVSLMNDLETLFVGNADMRRFVSHPVGYDFYGGANLLDGPFPDRTSTLVQSIWQKRKSIKPDSNDIAKMRSGFHVEGIMEHFIQAANVYDPLTLPRFHLQWLENLARLHEMRGNRAEGAEIRWYIFQTCCKIEHRWQGFWVPKPPLHWYPRGLQNLDEYGTEYFSNAIKLPQQLKDNLAYFSSSSVSVERNFYFLLNIELHRKAYSKAWFDYEQFRIHIQTALSVVTERYCAVHLVQFAERSSKELIALNQFNPEFLAQEYLRISNAWKATTEKGITFDMALGTYYRVHFTGLGMPVLLRDKEYIIRTANHIHVSEFHTLVSNHIKAVIAEGVQVKIIQDTNAVDVKDAGWAYIVMNNVKPLVDRKNLSYASRGFKLIDDQGSQTGSRQSWGKSKEFASHHTIHITRFQYSVPFTQDKAKTHAKLMTEQWSKQTILQVKASFPYILTRQEVIGREVVIFSPIEVAINDIEERMEHMEQELLGAIHRKQAEINNLMRIVQGTVMPQVNAGAAEVAKLFLGPAKLVEDEATFNTQLALYTAEVSSCANKEAEQAVWYQIQALQQERQKSMMLVQRLKFTLINFLQYSKLLILKSRFLLITDASNWESTDLFTDETSLAFVGTLVAGLNAIEGTTGSPGGVGAGTNAGVSAGNTNSLGPGNNSINLKNRKTTLSATTSNTVDTSINGSVVSTITTVTITTNNPPAGGNTVESNYYKWQTEMEKGYEVLVQGIYPFISDVKEAEIFNCN